MTVTLAARHDRCGALCQADRMALAGSTSTVLIGQPKGPQEPPLRSLCGPACREQPGTGENSRRQASAFTRVFPRVPGCARSTNVSGRKSIFPANRGFVAHMWHGQIATAKGTGVADGRRQETGRGLAARRVGTCREARLRDDAVSDKRRRGGRLAERSADALARPGLVEVPIGRLRPLGQSAARV
jgi:hypothetical protein